MGATAYFADGRTATYPSFDMAKASGAKHIVYQGETFLLLFGEWVGIGVAR